MERNYATLMDAARRGIVTPELKKVAEKEYMAVEDLMPLVASGKVAIPANKLHTSIDPEGIGSMLRTKINVNLGVSKDCKDYDVEMQKVLSAVNMGAEAIMDLSSHGNTQPFRRKLTYDLCTVYFRCKRLKFCSERCIAGAQRIAGPDLCELQRMAGGERKADFIEIHGCT